MGSTQHEVYIVDSCSYVRGGLWFVSQNGDEQSDISTTQDRLLVSGLHRVHRIPYKLPATHFVDTWLNFQSIIYP